MDVDLTPSSYDATDDWDDAPYQQNASSSSSSTLPTQSVAGNLTTAEREWDSIEEKFTNDGYREGITTGKLSTLQSGFDEGYALSAPLAQRLGSLRGRAASLLAFLVPPPRARFPPAPTSATSDEKLIEAARRVVRDLGKLRMSEVLGRDEEAEAHMREHAAEGGDGEAEWQEGGETKEMEDLEALMESLSGGDGGGNKKQEIGGDRGSVDLGAFERRVTELERQVGILLSSVAEPKESK